MASIGTRDRNIQPGLHNTEGDLSSGVQNQESHAKIDTTTLKTIHLSLNLSVQITLFSSVDSSQLTHIPISGRIGCSRGEMPRTQFLAMKTWETPPPIISKSEFVPDALAEHLMRNKRDSTTGVKYMSGNQITNMEGALHTFVTPLAKITMTGDYVYAGSHDTTPLGVNVGRNVILSAAVQPDFEKLDVMLKVVGLGDEAIEGELLPGHFTILDVESKRDDTQRAIYDMQLLKHMVYHLTENHQLPSKRDVGCQFMNQDDGKRFLEGLIHSAEIDISKEVQGKYMEVGGHIISVECLFNVYVNQLRNELSTLEAVCTQGYVYTIDPPSIFAQQLGLRGKGAEILNRFQTAAFKYLDKSTSFANLKQVAFNDYLDKENIDLLRSAFQMNNGHISVVKKADLFPKPNNTYVGRESLALVLHNNSDAFAQNIESEGLGSMDGAIGCYSDAACTLKRDRPDLLACVV